LSLLQIVRSHPLRSKFAPQRSFPASSFGFYCPVLLPPAQHGRCVLLRIHVFDAHVAYPSLSAPPCLLPLAFSHFDFSVFSRSYPHVRCKSADHTPLSKVPNFSPFLAASTPIVSALLFARLKSFLVTKEAGIGVKNSSS